MLFLKGKLPGDLIPCLVGRQVSGEYLSDFPKKANHGEIG